MLAERLIKNPAQKNLQRIQDTAETEASAGMATSRDRNPGAPSGPPLRCSEYGQASAPGLAANSMNPANKHSAAGTCPANTIEYGASGEARPNATASAVASMPPAPACNMARQNSTISSEADPPMKINVSQ